MNTNTDGILIKMKQPTNDTIKLYIDNINDNIRSWLSIEPISSNQWLRYDIIQLNGFDRIKVLLESNVQCSETFSYESN